MQIDYVGRDVQFSDAIRAYTERNLQRAIRFLEDPVEIRVILEKAGYRQIAEIQVHHRFGDLQAKEEATGLREAILEAVEKIEKQARRARKKFMDKRRRVGGDFDAPTPEA